MSIHSLGPWKVAHYARFDHGEPMELAITDAAGAEIARVDRYANVPDGHPARMLRPDDPAKEAASEAIGEANARLVAAAPELLELVNRLALMGEDWELSWTLGWKQRLRELAQEGQALLAHVRGTEGEGNGEGRAAGD